MRTMLAKFFVTLGLLCLLSHHPLLAQSIKITDVKIGLPPGRYITQRDDNNNPAYVVKSGTWAPVYVQLEILKEQKYAAAIVVETTDADNLNVSMAVPLQNLSDQIPGSRVEPTELRFLPYVRPSGRYDLNITVRQIGDGKPGDWRAISEPYRVRYLRTRDVASYVVLSLGTKLPGFDLPNEKSTKDDEAPQEGLRGGRVESAAILNLNELPDRWIGYQCADIVFLTTGAASDKDFLTPLFTDPKYRTRLDALLEWVRRGGKLVVSVGSNAGLVSQYPLLQEILPVTINRNPPNEQVKEIDLEWVVGNMNSRLGRLSARAGSTFALAKTSPKPDHGYRQFVPSYDDTAGDPRASQSRIVTQAALGMGKVTLVAFDLDRSPFVDFAGRQKIWDQLLSDGGSKRASAGTAQRKAPGTAYVGQGFDTEDEFATGLREHLDRFEGVPVISFGWVALFIALYTLLIGPIEYIVLKKVFKRLELTWITFPIIVLTVSTVAYFTAYWLKGSDLMINKVDIVDVDAGSDRIYGRSWFSIFSPRIDTYRLGVEPNSNWAAAKPDVPHTGSHVDWVGSSRGNARGGGGFFRRSYSYQLAPPENIPGRYPFSDGLLDVPIQVWSTKPFMADWSAQIDKAQPLVKSQLIHPPSDLKKVAGTFTLNLPLAEIKDAYVIYAGKAYKQENAIVTGQPVTVLLDKDDPTWLSTLSNPLAVIQLADQSSYNGGNKQSAGNAQLFGVLFHDQQTNEDRPPTNATLRRLDQSWRISEHNRDELIIVGKLPPTRGMASTLLGSKDSISPTRLWLKELPSEKPWPGIVGTLTQETYVRVFIPIKPVRR